MKWHRVTWGVIGHVLSPRAVLDYKVIVHHTVYDSLHPDWGWIGALMLKTAYSGLWSVTVLKGIPYRNRWEFLLRQSPAKASRLIWLYRFSGPVRLRLPYYTILQSWSPSFLYVRVAANAIGHPSMWSSCSACGSKYTCTAGHCWPCSLVLRMLMNISAPIQILLWVASRVWRLLYETYWFL